MKSEETKKYRKAKKRVAEIKGFRVHLTIYMVINTVILIIKSVGTSYYGESFMGPIWHFSTFATWLFWGIGLGFHALKVFYAHRFFGKGWEERQIQKYLDKEKNEAKKFSK